MKTLAAIALAIIMGLAGRAAQGDPASHGGDFAEASVDLGDAVRLLSRIATPIASITLEEGDWDVRGNVNFFVLNSTPPVYVGASIAPVDSINTDGFVSFNAANTTPGLGLMPCALPSRRFHITHEGQTLNLVAFAVFANGSVQPWGFISATRVSGH